MMVVAVTGGTGAMGRTVREVVADRTGFEVGMVISRESPGALEADAEVISPAELSTALDNDIDAVIDFSAPTVAVKATEAARAAGVPIVIGTTGLDDDQHATIEEAAAEIPVLYAPNFSRGIHVLIQALETTIDLLPTYDIEITETHHHRKQDAPSGTAMRLLETIEEGREASTIVHGRSGNAPRSSDEIGVHARRAGSITGEHEILLAGGDEEIRLIHRAESRRVFAHGAIDAAEWLTGKSPGWYQFGDVVEA